MQKQIPSLLLQPDQCLQERLLDLASAIPSPKEHVQFRNYFVQNYLHCPKAKLEKKREKAADSLGTKSSRKKRSERLQPATHEQLFLSEAIGCGLSWKDIADRVGFRPSITKHNEWNYSTFLIFALLKQLKGTLGYFLALRLMNRTWSISEQMFNALGKSAFLTHKINQLLSRDLTSIKRIQFAFLRDLILAIKLDEGVEGSLARVKYSYWLNLKNQEKELMDVSVYSEEWAAYLCKKVKGNTKLERPSIKYEKRQFRLKWTKARPASTASRDYFDQKLARVTASRSYLQEQFISQIEVILLQGVIQGKEWAEVKKQIELFTEGISQIEQQSKMPFEIQTSKDGRSVYSLTSLNSRHSQKETQKSAKLSQSQKSIRVQHTIQLQAEIFDQEEWERGKAWKTVAKAGKTAGYGLAPKSQIICSNVERAYLLERGPNTQTPHSRKSVPSFEVSKEASLFMVTDKAVQVDIGSYGIDKQPESKPKETERKHTQLETKEREGEGREREGEGREREGEGREREGEGREREGESREREGQRKSLTTLDKDQELVLSYCLKIMQLVGQIRSKSFPEVPESDLDGYCQQNIENIESAYIESLKLFESHPQLLDKLEHKNLKSLIYILLATKDSELVKHRIGDEWKSKKENVRNSKEVMNYVRKEFDKIHDQVLKKLKSMRLENSKQSA